MFAQELAKQLIKQFESLRLVPYYCPAGVKTIGYGHVIKPHELPYLDTAITKEQAERLLDEDVKQVQIALQRCCHVYLSVNQQAALISFIFNCGAGAFKTSTLLKRLNKEQYLLAPAAPIWLSPSSRSVIEELVLRASASTLAPASPIWLLQRLSEVIEELILRASASPLAPASPIWLLLRLSIVREKLVLRASASTVVKPRYDTILVMTIEPGNNAKSPRHDGVKR